MRLQWTPALKSRPFDPRGHMSAPGATITDSDRLAKLWDAYRAQEEEYHAALAHAERLTRELEGRGHAVAERERLVAQKNAEIQRLNHVIAQRDERIAQLQALE